MWLLQEMLEQYTRLDNDYLRFRHALDLSNTPYTIVSYKDSKLRVLEKDFNVHLDSENILKETTSKPFLIKGSVSLEQQFKKHENNCLKEEIEISFENIFDYIPKEYMLNVPYQIDYLKDIKAVDTKIMLRPVADNKAITGGIFTDKELKELQLNYHTFKNASDIESVKFMASDIKDVVNEYRFFIIDGVIATYSTYMFNYLYNTEPKVPKHIVDFATKINLKYPISKNTVLDICELGDGKIKVVEFNSLACSGLYNCDEHKIVADLNNLLSKF